MAKYEEMDTEDLWELLDEQPGNQRARAVLVNRLNHEQQAAIADALCYLAEGTLKIADALQFILECEVLMHEVLGQPGLAAAEAIFLSREETK